MGAILSGGFVSCHPVWESLFGTILDTVLTQHVDIPGARLSKRKGRIAGPVCRIRVDAEYQGLFDVLRYSFGIVSAAGYANLP